MNQSNSNGVTRVSVDSEQPVARRPVCVTIALVVFWALLTCTALGAISQLSKPLDPGEQESMSYVAYLAAMVFVPAFLLVKIARAGNWARIALLTLYVLNLFFRIYLFANDGQFTAPLAAWIIVPAIVEAIAFMLLFLPGSSHWFAKRADAYQSSR